MKAIRTLLIFQLLVCLITAVLGCQSRSCHPFTGLNNCFNTGGKEPRLPPRDNSCCGPHCVYKPPNPQNSGPCSPTARTRCLLDTHCGGGMAFTFVCLSDCDLSKKNAVRLKGGFAREYLVLKILNYFYLCWKWILNPNKLLQSAWACTPR